MGCNQLGKASDGKNVPESKNCGIIINCANGGMVESLFAILLIINPIPINKINPIKDKMIIFIKVIQPLTNI